MLSEAESDQQYKMTKEKLKKQCRKNKLYLLPELNDVLYLHYQGKNKKLISIS